MEVQSITFTQLMGAVAVIAVLLGLYNVCMTAVKNHREEIKLKSEPLKSVNERLDKHEDWFAADKHRIQVLEQQQVSLTEHNKQQDQLANITIRAQLAMLRHMQHNNNLEGMRDSEKEITDYLTGKTKE